MAADVPLPWRDADIDDGGGALGTVDLNAFRVLELDEATKGFGVEGGFSTFETRSKNGGSPDT